MYKLIIVFVIFVFIILSTACYDKVNENNLVKTVLKENKLFSVRIKAYKENSTMGIAGIEYLVESSTVSKETWRKIVTVSHDDGINFSESNIIFPTSSTGFVFMTHNYSVTLDDGKTWINSKIKEAPSCLIDSVKFSNYGTGEMELKCNLDKVKLFTTNFGVDWGR
jgi:hypothetical protein